MVEAWNEINLEMRSNRERLDEIGKQIRANTRATLDGPRSLLRAAGRTERFRGTAPAIQTSVITYAR